MLSIVALKRQAHVHSRVCDSWHACIGAMVDSATKALALRRLVADNIARAMEHREESQSAVARKGSGAHQTTIGRLAAVGSATSRLSPWRPLQRA